MTAVVDYNLWDELVNVKVELVGVELGMGKD